MRTVATTTTTYWHIILLFIYDIKGYNILYK